MIKITVEEDVFMEHLQQWLATGRSLVTLPEITLDKLELILSVVSVSNTKRVYLNKIFYSYQEIMGYYGQLLDKLNDE